MTWTPKYEELQLEFDPDELKRYRAGDPACLYSRVAWPRSIGKSHHGEFPLVVATEYFHREGFTVWASEPELPKNNGFILVSYPGKRENRHPAYEKMVTLFGETTLQRLNEEGDARKRRYSRSRGGGDPDLFVFRGHERFFVEMKWRDRITPKQELTFPLIEKYCAVPIKIARVRVANSR